jgi:hypothetical protein
LPKNAVQEWDTIAANNTDAGGISCAEGMARASVNNWMREAMAQIKKAVANQGSDIASAGTTDIGAATGQYVRITGSTAITSLGTVNAGTMRWVEFTGALTLTHNATSLKLPGSANITTAAGDVGLFVSLGSGDWKCLYFAKGDGSPITAIGTSAIANDAVTYAKIQNVSAASRLLGRGSAAGSGDAEEISLGTGLSMSATTLAVGTVAGPKYIIADQKTSGTNGGGITSGSFVKRTLNTELLDQIGITTSSSVMALSAGTYIGRFVTTVSTCDLAQSRLRDTTNSVDLILSANCDAPAGENGQPCVGFGAFTLSGSANVELQTRVGTTNGTDGGGSATSFGTETYSVVYLEKVA